VNELPPRIAQQVFELSLELLVVADRTSHIVKVNESWRRVLGYEPADLVGVDISDLHHPDDVPRTRERLMKVIAGEPLGVFENRYRHADGHYVWLRWSVAIDQESGYVYGAARDITDERRRIEDARGATRRLEEAQRVAKIGSWEQDLRTGERIYTPEMFAIQGMDPETDEPWGLDELLARVVPEHHHRIHEAMERMYAEPGVHEVEYRMHTPSVQDIRTLMELVRDADGTAVRIRGTTQDVTELRQNERRLSEAERVAGLGSFEVRLSDGHTVWSAGSYPLYDRDPELGPVDVDEFWSTMFPGERDAIRARVAEAEAAGRPWELEHQIVTRAGQHRTLALRGERFMSGDETYFRGTIQDVSRERRATRQQQEIARLGQLALAGTDLRELFEEVCRVTVDVLETDMVAIVALQGDGSFALAAHHGFPPPYSDGGTVIAVDEDSIVRHALASDAALLVPDWANEDRYGCGEKLLAIGAHCTMALPIRGRDAPFGALLTAAFAPGVEDPANNVAFLDALGSFLATAIARARHEAEIAALATLRGRLVAENLEAEERVRQRISEQLHDGALQDLLAARQDLVEAAADSSDAKMRAEMLGYAREGVERAVKLLREAVHALHPVVLQHGGLEAAMQAAAGQAARQGGFNAEVTVDPAATGLRDELVMSLARELLNNCAKHAQAGHVHVTVGRDDGTLLLEVADDGRGLDPAAVDAAPLNGHIGLASLTQRVEAVGGTLNLHGATDGGGTTVVACLPIG
jgi:PAS domain S-box-containing protein